jgi:hypothetical protein
VADVSDEYPGPRGLISTGLISSLLSGAEPAARLSGCSAART